MSKAKDQEKLHAAFSLHQAGNLRKAADLYREIISRDPNNCYALHYLGVVEGSSGNYEQAKSYMARSLTIEPQNIQFMENYATILFQMRDYNSSLQVCEHGLQLNSANCSLLYLSAISLFRLERFKESLVQFDKLLSIQPSHLVALNERASVLAEMKKYDAALTSVEKALTLRPDYAEGHLNKANLCALMKRLDEATTSYDKALTLNPDLPDAWIGRGNLLRETKRHDEAFAAYDKALALKPDLDAAWLGRGNIFFELKRYDDALAAYDKALAINPSAAAAWLGRGNVQRELKRYNNAHISFDKALSLEPDLGDAWLGRGNIFAALNHFDEASAAYEKALELKPDLAEALLGRGNLFLDLKRYDDAFVAYDKALALDPNLLPAEGGRLYCKMSLCDWSNFTAECEHLISSVKHNKATTPFVFTAISASPEDQFKCARLWVSEKYPLSNKPFWNGEIYKHDKIRLAYVSADFRQHPVSYLCARMFEFHDKYKFKVTGISLGPDDSSEIRRRLKNAFSEFIDVASLSDDEIASRIRNDEIDILVNLAGFTLGERSGIFARRPAPIQINYLGYPSTMGASYIDYLIADATLIPPSQQINYSEKIAYLPGSYMPHDGLQRYISDRRFDRPEFGLPQDAFVFSCFNNAYKLNPYTFDVWMSILKKVDGSVLWLSDTNATAVTNLKKQAVIAGIEPTRLIFAERLSSPAEHLARHRLADLFLDTSPYNAHTTASDALWAGLPVLTKIGETFAGRVAASLLNAIGLPELIVTTLEAYEELAVELATNPEKLATIKDKLAENRPITSLFDTRLFTRHIEKTYTLMYERYQAGLAPDQIAISS